jgi:antitoxin (DNA-binding transcriptional repressor) of toxin-antitoxin stability system
MIEIPAANYISASQTRKRLSSLVRLVMAGESFIITDDLTGEPIAELVPASDKDDFSNTPEDEM